MHPKPELDPRFPHSRRASTPEAYRALGVSPDDVARQPSIRHELARIGRDIQRAANVPASPYYYLSLSDAAEARAVLAAYYSLPERQRVVLPIEAFCVAAKASTLAVYDAVLVAMQRSNRLVSAAILSSTHPAVASKTVDLALNATDDDVRLRAQVVVHRIVGALPMPRHSQTIVVNTTAQASANAAAVGAAPPPEQTIRRLSERLNALRPGAAATVPVPALPAAPRVESPIESPFAPRHEVLRRQAIEVVAEPDADVDDEIDTSL